MTPARRKATRIFDVVLFVIGIFFLMMTVIQQARSVEPPQMQIGRMK